jgi:hypothetical protein
MDMFTNDMKEYESKKGEHDSLLIELHDDESKLCMREKLLMMEKNVLHEKMSSLKSERANINKQENEINHEIEVLEKTFFNFIKTDNIRTRRELLLPLGNIMNAFESGDPKYLLPLFATRKSKKFIENFMLLRIN